MEPRTRRGKFWKRRLEPARRPDSARKPHRPQAELHPALEPQSSKTHSGHASVEIRDHPRCPDSGPSPTTRSWRSASEGSVTLAEAPQQDCDFERIRAIVGLDPISSAFYRRSTWVAPFEIIDLRREAVTYPGWESSADRRHAARRPTAGYRDAGSGAAAASFEGAVASTRIAFGAPTTIRAPRPSTIAMGGRNEYLLSQTVLSADLDRQSCQSSRPTRRRA